MIKSYRQPITLPAIVTAYFEPSAKNIVDFVGGNRATHQMYVAHQIRLLNTIISAAKGKANVQPKEIASQNRALKHDDHIHLNNLVEHLLKAELVDHEAASIMVQHLIDLFAHLFPHVNPTNSLFNKGNAT